MGQGASAANRFRDKGTMGPIKEDANNNFNTNKKGLFVECDLLSHMAFCN